MSKELKPYEKENLTIKRLRECKNSRQYLITQLNATERGFARCKKTYERDIELYTENLEKTRENLEILDQKIKDYSEQLKEFLPKPKPKIVVVDLKSVKEECKYCGKKYAKSGIKSHQKACLKKIELAKLQKEIDKLELEDTLEELDKKEDAEIIEVVEDIIDDLKDSIDLDKLTEDVSFIEIKDPPEHKHEWIYSAEKGRDVCKCGADKATSEQKGD